MRISIAERLRPFVHVPGQMCLLPLSKLSFKIYPAFVQVFDQSKSEPFLVAEFPVEVEGPVEEFTVLQDLESGYLKVWGHAKNGFFRYRIYATSHSTGFCCVLERVPLGKEKTFLPEVYCEQENFPEVPSMARLSFGVTKTADWTLVQRRALLSEILPYWYRLGQWLTAVPEHTMGTASLLEGIEQSLYETDRTRLASHFRNAYLAGFEGLLACRLYDRDHQGFLSPKVTDKDVSPLILLTKGARLIEQMLIKVKSETEVEILPCLLPELHAGRMCGFMCEEMGRFDLEWTKKKIRRLIFHSAKDQELQLHFQSGLKSFRLRREGSKISSNKTCGEVLSFVANATYFFDRFQK